MKIKRIMRTLNYLSHLRYRDSDFHLHPSGLYRRIYKTEKGKVTLLRISDAIKVTAYLNNYETQHTIPPSPDRYLAISFLTPKNKTDKIEVNFPRRILNQPNLLISALMGYGFYLNLSEKKWFIEYLMRQNPEKSMFYVAKPGWTSDLKAFVFSDRTISKDKELEDNLKLINPTNRFKSSGTNEDWQKHVVRPSIKYPLFAFALAVGFTPILLRLVNMRSFCINFYDESSIGKTTAIQIASSVWGCGSEPSDPNSYIYNWNTTGNALNCLAAGSNDVLLAIDELGSFVGDSLGQVVYALSGGKSRAGMKSNNQLRDDSSWNTVLLSTSEVSGRQKMEEAGRVYTGQLNRFIDIPVSGLEISGDAELVDALKKSCSEYYGTAGIKLIETITNYSKGRDDLIKEINKWHKESFDYLMALDEVKAITLTTELSRAINRFALIFTAAKFIAGGNIVGLFETDPNVDYNEIDKESPEYKTASESATKVEKTLRATLTEVFKAWLKNLNLEPRSSSERILTLIKNFIFKHQKKFIHDDVSAEKLPPSIFGYYHKSKKLFLLTDETFAMACPGFSVTESAKALKKHGLLHTLKNDNHLNAQFTVNSIAGKKKIRFYAIKNSILTKHGG